MRMREVFWPLPLVLLALIAVTGCAAPRHVYLTWQGDMRTTMTVNYQTDSSEPESVIYYDTQSHAGVIEEYAFRMPGDSHTIAGLEERLIHQVELEGLTPDTSYYFVAGESAAGIGEDYHFRTLPEEGEEIRFIVGGDMGALPRARRLLRQAAEYDPMFCVVGGDIAYANGELKNLYRWDRWFRQYSEELVREDGALVPMVLGVGNHEINRDFEEPELNAPFYVGFFAQGGSSYFALQPSERLLLLILDSGYLAPIGGEQRDWLAERLAEHEATPQKIAVYHVPLYPSYRSFDGDLSTLAREQWLPLFDQHKLQMCFEQHDHTFKATYPLRNNEIAEGGTRYLGDGAFGVPPRPVDGDRWYLEAAASEGHFWVVESEPELLRARAVGLGGLVLYDVQTPTP